MFDILHQDGYLSLNIFVGVVTSDRRVRNCQLGKAVPLKPEKKYGWWLRNGPCHTVLRMKSCA